MRKSSCRLVESQEHEIPIMIIHDQERLVCSLHCAFANLSISPYYFLLSFRLFSTAANPRKYARVPRKSWCWSGGCLCMYVKRQRRAKNMQNMIKQPVLSQIRILKK